MDYEAQLKLWQEMLQKSKDDVDMYSKDLFIIDCEKLILVYQAAINGSEEAIKYINHYNTTTKDFCKTQIEYRAAKEKADKVCEETHNLSRQLDDLSVLLGRPLEEE